MFNDAGVRSPVFQIDNIYLSSATATKLLATVEGVTDVKQRKLFAKSSDIHVEFQYLGRPYIVWEPYGDNSRFWIGPADMVTDAAPVRELDSTADICRLEDAFKRYQPPFYRKILGDIFTLRFLHRRDE